MSDPKTTEKKSRRPKLDEERVEKLCAFLRAGNYVKTACAASGISQSTYYAWEAAGKADREAGKRTRYLDFLESIEVATAESEVMLVAEVRKEGGRGALEVLKRRFRDRWGDKTALEHTGADGVPLPPAGAPPINLTVNMQGAPGDQKDPWVIKDGQDPEPTNGADPWDSENLTWDGNDPAAGQDFTPEVPPEDPPPPKRANAALSRPAEKPQPGMPPDTGGRPRDPDA